VTLARLARHVPPRAPVAVALIGVWLAISGGQSHAQVKAPVESESQSGASAADQLADPNCLTVTRSSASTYTISNEACPEQSVLAAIELGGGSSARCFTKKIRTQISIASEAAAPTINYQCIEGAQGCSVEIVRGMFPECHAG
jgi:hypothetical protein